MVQLKGNLIHARGYMSRVAMREPAISYAGTHKPIINITA